MPRLILPLYLPDSSDFGASLAAELGLPFAFASHFAPDSLETALRVYRARFKPSEQCKLPHAMVGVNIIAADNDSEARRLATTQKAMTRRAVFSVRRYYRG